ncbi:MAG: DUF4388 domain-containing protein [Ktedonobacteraceae bacterium]|nr:DUF4388 domain-containing protein [Ktedonobacteraceae bacterium]
MTTSTVLSGLLKEFGLVEVLQVVEMGGMTGAIHLKQGTGRMGILYFNEGRLASCSEFDAGTLTIGDVLQQLGMTTYHSIEQAFAQQLRDPLGKRIGERLVMMGAISEQQLKEALRTKALWIARELGLWKDGTYEFIASKSIQKLLPYGETSLDIDVMRVTMEIVRYSDEWQEVESFLPHGMRTMLIMTPSLPYPLRFDVRTMELLTHVNLYRSIRRIASAVRRPELDVARDLARLVEQRMLFPIPQDIVPPTNGRKIRLPDPAEKLRLEHFELLNLIERMETDWEEHRTPMEQLPALAEFVNWTMDALSEACYARGVELDPNTLGSLMHSEGLASISNYRFRVEHNHIDVGDFAVLCNRVMSGDLQHAAAFYEEATKVLQRLLSCIFEMINSRIASPQERLQNQAVWETMFEQFELQRNQAL